MWWFSHICDFRPARRGECFMCMAFPKFLWLTLEHCLVECRACAICCSCCFDRTGKKCIAFEFLGQCSICFRSENVIVQQRKGLFFWHAHGVMVLIITGYIAIRFVSASGYAMSEGSFLILVQHFFSYVDVKTGNERIGRFKISSKFTCHPRGAMCPWREMRSKLQKQRLCTFYDKCLMTNIIERFFPKLNRTRNNLICGRINDTSEIRINGTQIICPNTDLVHLLLSACSWGCESELSNILLKKLINYFCKSNYPHHSKWEWFLCGDECRCHPHTKYEILHRIVSRRYSIFWSLCPPAVAVSLILSLSLFLFVRSDSMHFPAGCAHKCIFLTNTK